MRGDRLSYLTTPLLMLGFGMALPASEPDRPVLLFPHLWVQPQPETATEHWQPGEPVRVPSADLPDPLAPAPEPSRNLRYQLEQTVPLPLPGEFFVFGRVGTGESKDLKVTGDTGVGWKLPLQPGAEVLVRSGTALSCNGLPVPARMLDDSQWLVEVQYHWRLLSWAGLEYQGTAFPSGPERVNQDLGFVFPLGPMGQFRLGTRHSWQHTPQAQPWMENLQLQFGSTLRW